MALAVGLLYFLPFLLPLGPLANALAVDDISAMFACGLLALAIISYVASPRTRMFELGLAQYVLLLGLIGYMIYSSGGIGSSFIALWLLVVVFASVFRWYGQIAVVGFASFYLAYISLQLGAFAPEAAITIGLITILPLIASFIMFHNKTKKETKEDVAYHTLASELSQVNSKSDVVISAIDDGVIALNSKGIIELINPAAQRILGWGTNDAVGLDYKSVLKLTDAEDQPITEAADPIGRALSSNRDEHSQDLYVTINNKRKNLSLVISPIGQVGQGIILVFRDITKERAEEREQAEFVSTASHEMRTPVASIEGYLGLALNPATAQIDEKAREYVSKAQESAQHLGRLFQDLLDASKAEDGRLTNHPKVVDIISYVGDIVEGLRSKADAKQLRLFFKPSSNGSDTNRVVSPIYYADVDQDHLRQVVGNLVENAIKYTPEGDVIVDVTGDEGKIRISVQDSGIGIPAEDIPHLFQKFYRVDNSKTREIGGTGLGLYISRRMAEAMGGRLMVESEFQKGSTFCLELPRLDQQEALHRLETAAEAPPEIIVDSSPRLQAPQAPPAPTPVTTPSVPAPTPPAPALSLPVQPVAAPAPVPAQVPVSPSPVQPAQPSPAPAPTLATIEQNAAYYAAARRDQPGVAVPERR